MRIRLVKGGIAELFNPPKSFRHHAQKTAGQSEVKRKPPEHELVERSLRREILAPKQSPSVIQTADQLFQTSDRPFRTADRLFQISDRSSDPAD